MKSDPGRRYITPIALSSCALLVSVLAAAGSWLCRSGPCVLKPALEGAARQQSSIDSQIESLEKRLGKIEAAIGERPFSPTSQEDPDSRRVVSADDPSGSSPPVLPGESLDAAITAVIVRREAEAEHENLRRRVAEAAKAHRVTDVESLYQILLNLNEELQRLHVEYCDHGVVPSADTPPYIALSMAVQSAKAKARILIVPLLLTLSDGNADEIIGMTIAQEFREP